MVFIEDFVPN